MPFVDTNILVYARDKSDPGKQARAAEILGVLWRSRTGRLSLVIHSLQILDPFSKKFDRDQLTTL